MSNLLYDSLFGCHAGDDKPWLTFDDGSEISDDGFCAWLAGSPTL